jgi:hypothetical protein
MRAYYGYRQYPNDTASDVIVTVTSAYGTKFLRIEPSLKLQNHSPTGFSWGYNGSGPAQLALAILLDFYGDKEIALAHYQDFKDAFVSRWGDQWAITAPEIEEWQDKTWKKEA